MTFKAIYQKQTRYIYVPKAKPALSSSLTSVMYSHQPQICRILNLGKPLAPFKQDAVTDLEKFPGPSPSSAQVALTAALKGGVIILNKDNI